MKSFAISKPRFIFFSIKQNLLPILFCLFTIFLVVFSSSNLAAAKSGLALWANNVIPSLLPFFIATELLSHTNIVSKLGKILTPIMKPIFNVPGQGAYAFIMGIISGYPIGAKIVTDFRQKGICSKEEGERLLAFTNNSGPLFIIGTVGISLFGNSTIGLLLLVTHILACVSVGIVFRFWKASAISTKKDNCNYSVQKESVTFSSLGEVLSKSIISSINTILMIGGFIVLFSVILSILQKSNFINLISTIFFPLFKLFGIDNIQFCYGFFSGLLELTNGVTKIATISYKAISTNIIITSFLLGFGGISILLQVFSITSKSDISIKPYILGKFLHGIFAAMYTYIFISCFPIFNLNL